MKNLYSSILAFFVFTVGFSQTSGPTGNSPETGITDGQLSVSLTGAATYNVPITLPPGINGVMPQVNLSYSSQSGNGDAGFGWSIGGMSHIVRIPSTKFHDNNIDAVDFDPLDRFALDGQRLLVKNGTSGVYGANGTVYETEKFSNLKITSVGVHPNGAAYGPASFKVEYPDGAVGFYGITANSRTLFDYALTYWQNPQGVRISYYYNNNNNYINIAVIRYGTTFETEGFNVVNFSYVPRQRPEQNYIGGVSVLKNTILKEIRIGANNVAFKNYVLTYEPTTLGYERLKNITEKTGDDSKNLNPTIFNYTTTTNTNLFNIQTPVTLGNQAGINYVDWGSVSGDFDGDQKMDVILYPKTGAQANATYTVYSNLQGQTSTNGLTQNPGSFTKIFPISLLKGNDAIGYKLFQKQGWCVTKYVSSTNITSFSSYVNGGSSIETIDYKEYSFPKVTYETYDNSAACHRWAEETTGTFTPTKTFIEGDFNGDGLTDVLAFENNATYTVRDQCDRIGGTQPIYNQTYTARVYFVNLDKRLTTNFVNIAGILNRNTARELKVADFNGDGKSDVYEFEGGTMRVYSLKADNTLETLATYSDPGIVVNDLKLIGDYNGDGKMDFVRPVSVGSDNWDFYLSTGSTTGFTKFTTAIGFPYNVTSNQWIGGLYQQDTVEYDYIASDFNGDGKTDILRQQNFTINCKGDYVHGYDYSWDGTPDGTKLTLLENLYCNATGIGFAFVDTNFQLTGVRRNPIPILTNHNNVNKNLEYGLVSGGTVKSFSSPKDTKIDVLLNSITTGNGMTKTVTYKPLKYDSSCGTNCNTVFQNSEDTEFYPNADILLSSMMRVVTKVEEQSASTYRKQQYAYYGAVGNLEGIGFLGFRGIMQTNWTNAANANLISNVTKYSIGYRGAKLESFSSLGLILPQTTTPSSGFISKSNFVHNIDNNTQTVELPLLPNKVFKVKNTKQEDYNGLENTSTITLNNFDVYNNLLQSTTTLKNNTVVEQLSQNTMTYEDQPQGTAYYVGRIKSKVNSVTTYLPTQDIMQSEELYNYQDHLLTQTKKKLNASNYITEDNIYDAYGNITKKTLSYPGLTARETNYEYDPTTHRFLTKKIDVEGLQAIYDYNLSSGVLNYEINPYGIQTWYYYDKWFKKIQRKDYLSKTVNYYFTRTSEKTTITTADDDGSGIIELYDDLGRKIQSGIKDISGNFSYIDYVYDIYDRNYKTSEPHFGATTTPTQWNEMQYDAYGRVVQSLSYTGKTLNITYDGLSGIATERAVSVSPPETVVKIKTSIKNAIGNTISVTDDGGTISYTYYANGNIKSSTINNATITITQDDWGRKLSLTDTSAGGYSYTYNGFGELLTETTPKGTTTYSLDDFGKLTSKSVVGDFQNFNTTYEYDGTTKLLTNVTGHDNLTNQDFLTAYIYDGYKRMIKTTETNPQSYFEKQYGYDDFGRVVKEYYKAKNNSDNKVSDKWVRYTFVNGYKSELRDGGTTGDTSGALLRKLNTVNARGQILSASSGDYISEIKTYDAFGMPATTDFTVTSGPYASRPPVRPFLTLTNSFDQQTGRLYQRTNSIYAWTENFTFDNLDRLLTYKDATESVVSQSYENDGKIATNNLGEYRYTSKPYQNTDIKLATSDLVVYYKNRSPQTVTYNALKRPVSISETGMEKIDFEYNASDTRTVMYYGDMQTNKDLRMFRKYYSSDGTMEIKRNLSNGSIEFVTYLGGDGYSAPVCLKSDGTTQNYLYLHRDYQGSILAITSSAGQLLENRMYDAWGAIIKYWNINGISTVPTTEGVMLLDRGYTGHEHLLGVALINMNARLYDPKLHRFLSPDNFVQQPDNTQSYNRYAYCVNNPLMYTDPTGDYAVIDDIIAGAIGGLINLGVNLFNGNVHNAWDGLAAFGAGAAAGVLALYPQFGGWAAGGAIVGGTNSWLAGTDVMQGVVMGGVTGQVGGMVGSWASGVVGSVVVNGMTTTSPVLTGAVVGSLSGAVTGAITGFGFALVSGAGVDDALRAGLYGAEFGLVTGGITGSIGAYGKAVKDGRNPWSNSKPKPIEGEQHFPQYKLETGTVKPAGKSTPNTMYDYMGGRPAGESPISRTFYNVDGDVIYQIDFRRHTDWYPGHGHNMTVPGSLGSGHNLPQNHIPTMQVPKSIWNYY